MTANRYIAHPAPAPIIMKPRLIRCPYCHIELAFGVHHCINCSARLEYGVPVLAYAGVVLVSITVGAITANLLPPSLDWAGMAAMLIAGGGATLLVQKLYRDYVEFRRPIFRP
ncbi:hypothetical protein [Burkholderia ubonensis]|uniref:hypothetical protein n=1 Tax=Burkholderia ubonensis TaxID=101571 RepID=UPI00075F28CE|nr:hypothetical protein [Burkholderia ubonensis]